MDKKEVLKVERNGEEIIVNVLNCFELGNGKSYVLYKVEGEDGIYASSLVKTPSEMVFDEISNEEMDVIKKLLKEASEKEV